MFDKPVEEAQPQPKKWVPKHGQVIEVTDTLPWREVPQLRRFLNMTDRGYFNCYSDGGVETSEWIYARPTTDNPNFKE